MIDTQRLGSYLRALMREDVAMARLRTLPVAALARVARVDAESGLPSDVTPSRVERSTAAAPTPSASPATDEPPVDGVVARRGESGTGPAGAPPGAVVARGASPRTAVTAPLEAAMDGHGGTAAPAGTSAALALSAAGVLLRDVLRTAGPAATSDDVVPAARPLIGVPPHSQVATDRLALQIKDAVEFSGVFYESHLAQWADEVRPRGLLALEPQSKWTGSSDGAPGTAAAADVAAPLVRRQLDVLDTGRFLWRGDLWPGQAGALVIEEDDARPQRHDDLPHATTAARMRVELTLPGLGRVHASLGLRGDTLTLALHCDEPRSAGALRDAAPALRQAIGLRAIDVASLAITDGHA